MLFFYILILLFDVDIIHNLQEKRWSGLIAQPTIERRTVIPTRNFDISFVVLYLDTEYIIYQHTNLPSSFQFIYIYLL